MIDFSKLILQMYCDRVVLDVDAYLEKLSEGTNEAQKYIDWASNHAKEMTINDALEYSEGVVILGAICKSIYLAHGGKE